VIVIGNKIREVNSEWKIFDVKVLKIERKAKRINSVIGRGCGAEFKSKGGIFHLDTT